MRPRVVGVLLKASDLGAGSLELGLSRPPRRMARRQRKAFWSQGVRQAGVGCRQSRGMNSQGRAVAQEGGS